VQDRAFPVRDAAGRVVRIAGVAEDITERKLAEEALRESEARLRRIVESDVVGLIVADFTGRVTEANDEFLRMVGYGRDDLRAGRINFIDLTPPEHRILDERARAEMSAAGRHAPFEKEFRRKDGGRVPVLVGTAYLGTDARGVECGVGFIVDLTARKRAEEEMRAAKEAAEAARAAAEAANRGKDEFLSVLSHELRTPLTAMVGWVKLLRGGLLDAEQSASALETVERNLAAQTRLVEDLLDVSRIITGKMVLSFGPVAPAEVVAAALEVARPAAAAKGILLETAVESPVPVVEGDPDRLRQVVWNLVGNAVKFTPPGGRVRVTLRGEPGRAVLTVSDTGEGIPADFLPFVFDRFRQADAGKARRHGGLGLGLALVRHLVELHGGTVSAHSDGPGRGATFSVTLPAAGVGRGPGTTAGHLGSAEPAEPVGTAATAGMARTGNGTGNGTGTGTQRMAASGPLAGVRILLVEDTPDSRAMLSVALRLAGADVRAAADADEALSLADGDPPDVLVSDIGLPGRDGFSLIAELRSRPAARGGAVPAVALTGYASEEDRRRCLEAGFQGHLAKPAEPARLVEAVLSVLGRPSDARPLGF
jgi:PAS domain S-box-containing protein